MKKGSILLMFILLLGVLSLGTTTAILTVDTLVNGQVISGTAFAINTTVTAVENVKNMTLTWACTSPLAGGTTSLASGVNASGSTASFNQTINTKNVADCAGTLTAQPDNDSVAPMTSRIVTTVVFNNSKPVIAIGSANPASTSGSSIKEGTFTYTTNESVISATLHLGANAYSMKGSNTSWSYKFGKTSGNDIPEGVYLNYFVDTQETAGGTPATSPNSNIWIEYSHSNKKAVTYDTEGITDSGSSSSNSNTALILVLLAGGAVLLVGGKK